MFEYARDPELKRQADKRTSALLAHIKAEAKAQRGANGVTDEQKRAFKAKRRGWSGRYNNSNFGMGF